MPVTRVTRNFQITIPSEIRKVFDIREGEYLEVGIEDDKIVIKKLERKRKRISLGKRLTIDEIEREIAEGFKECTQ